MQFSPNFVSLQTCSGESLEVRGEANVPVRYGNQLAVIKIVVGFSNKPAILGRSWLQVIHMDCMELIVSVQGEKRLNLVERFSALFGPGVSTLEGSQVRITLQGGAQPEYYRPRSIPYTLQEKVDSELSRLQIEGILRPVESSQWTAPTVVVRKADRTVRLYGDYKVAINPYLESNPYPMPNSEDLFATLARGAIFSRLDTVASGAGQPRISDR